MKKFLKTLGMHAANVGLQRAGLPFRISNKRKDQKRFEEIYTAVLAVMVDTKTIGPRDAADAFEKRFNK